MNLQSWLPFFLFTTTYFLHTDVLGSRFCSADCLWVVYTSHRSIFSCFVNDFEHLCKVTPEPCGPGDWPGGWCVRCCKIWQEKRNVLLCCVKPRKWLSFQDRTAKAVPLGLNTEEGELHLPLSVTHLCMPGARSPCLGLITCMHTH